MKKIALALILAASAGSAFAWTLGVDAGRSDIGNAGNETAYRVSLAHAYNPNLSAEVSYMDSGKFLGAKTNAFDVAAVGSYPVYGAFSVTGRLGVSRTAAKMGGATDSNTGITAGIGGKYQFDKNWAATVTVDRYDNFADSDEAMDVIAMGAKYTF